MALKLIPRQTCMHLAPAEQAGSWQAAQRGLSVQQELAASSRRDLQLHCEAQPVWGPCCAALRWCQPLAVLQVASIAAAVKPGSKSSVSAAQAAVAPRGRASAPVAVSRRQDSGSPSKARKQDKGAPAAKGPPPGKGSEAQRQQQLPLTAEQEAERFMEQFVAYASPQGVPAPGEYMTHCAPGVRNNDLLLWADEV